MKHKYFLIIFTGFLGFLLNSCNVFEHKNAVPTYIHLDSFQFRDPTSLQGTASHNINTVFVYYNNGPVGVFDLPCTFPIVTTDSSGTLEVEPAIPQDGLNDFEIYYPFYTIDTFTFASSPGNIINHTPTTGYFSDVIVPFNQTFDASTTGGFSLLSGTGNFSVTNQPYPTSFQGSGSGVISITTGDSAEFIANGYVTLQPGVASFLELNYRCNTTFVIGMVSQLDGVPTTPYYLGGLKSNGTWQKVYFNLSQYISDYTSDNNEYYITIKLLLPAGQSTGQVYVDNLKVVTLPE